jgi:hypothetical protein
VAKWLTHLPFTAKVRTFSMREKVRTFSMRLEPSPYLKRVKSQRSAESPRFLRVLQFPPTGKVDRVG